MGAQVNSMREVHAIREKNLRRKEGTAQEIAREICAWVKANGVPATLALDYKWWDKAIISPYTAYVTNWSRGYSLKISEKELLAAIEDEGCYFRNFEGQSQIGLVSEYPFEEAPKPCQTFLPETEGVVNFQTKKNMEEVIIAPPYLFYQIDVIKKKKRREPSTGR